MKLLKLCGGLSNLGSPSQYLSKSIQSHGPWSSQRLPVVSHPGCSSQMDLYSIITFMFYNDHHWGIKCAVVMISDCIIILPHSLPEDDLPDLEQVYDELHSQSTAHLLQTCHSH